MSEVIEFSDEEDGSLSIEFCMGKGKMLAISVRPNGYISWVLCWDGHREHGTHKLRKRKRILFPTMLRKMWSGDEVQDWLDENVNKENT